MKKSLVLKLLPVALMAAIGLFLAAKAPPQADASVSGISPSVFTVNAGSPVSFSFVAQAGAGNIGVSASSTASTFINASCSGCAVSGNGTSSVVISPPSGTSNFTVGFTLDVACTVSGLPINVTATQGNSSIASGVTGSCACNSALYGNCGCTVITSNCCTVLTTACNCAAYSTLGCGCTAYTTLACGCGTYGYNNNCCAGYGQTNAVYVNGVLTSNCGACTTLVGGVYANPVYGNVYGNNNCGICTTTGLLANCAVGTSQVSVTVPGTAVCGSRFNVLVTVRNSVGGIALDGTQVALTSNVGAVTPNVTVTSGGIASSSLLLAPTGAGTATITATANGVSGSASVNVTCAAAPAPVQVIPAPVLPVVIPIISAPNAGDGGCLAKGGCN